MNMDFLSGILLAAVVLAAVVYLVKEIFGDRITGIVTEYSEKPERTPNHHLVGSVGTVISPPDGDEQLQRVRIGIERWNARVTSPDGKPLPEGTEVRVTAVNGLVLDVEESAAQRSAHDGAAGSEDSVETQRVSG